MDRLTETHAARRCVRRHGVSTGRQIGRKIPAEGDHALSVGIPRTDHLWRRGHDQLHVLAGGEDTEGDHHLATEGEGRVGHDGCVGQRQFTNDRKAPSPLPSVDAQGLDVHVVRSHDGGERGALVRRPGASTESVVSP